MNRTQKIVAALETARNNCLNASGSDKEFLLNNKLDNNPFCERVFDGLLCWPQTKAGILAYQSCNSSDLIKTLKRDRFATKQCTENGTWFVPENMTQHWSNLSECGGFYIDDTESSYEKLDPIYDEWLPYIKITSYFGYVLSVISLLVALVIFIKIKRLHCSRNKLHIHLFMSFIMRAVMFFLKDGLFVKGIAMTHDTSYINGEPNFNYSWTCKAFTSLRNYFIMANFTFMMTEGMYLHNLMFLNLFSDNHDTTNYYLLGWGLPIIFIIPWVILRILFDNELCWTQINSKYVALLIELPIGITVVINFILFLIIVKVLTVKLKFNTVFIRERSVTCRKLLKSTLILIPLFGIPYTISLVLSFYVGKSRILELVWLLFDQTFAAFQGLLAALLYCLLNTEVQTEIKRKYCSLKQRNDKEFRRSRTISNTQQTSLQNDETLENLNVFGITNEANSGKEACHM